ncbi:hypothetical protein LZ31DRAFT_590877 [Colletotrichum somersetense]|nr:hypothetical protein LZ31DRAFT_590877 [Colletotrichum somersetense]
MLSGLGKKGTLNKGAITVGFQPEVEDDFELGVKSSPSIRKKGSIDNTSFLMHPRGLGRLANPDGGQDDKESSADAWLKVKTVVVSNAPSSPSIENLAAAMNTMLEIESKSSDDMSDDGSRGDDISSNPQTFTRDSTEDLGGDDGYNSRSEGDNEIVDDVMSLTSLESG